jgi:hypothetical protein
MNILIIACACFVFTNFYILCTPSLLPAFPAINTTTGTSATAVVCEALLPLTGAPLAALYSMPVFTFWRALLQTVLPDDSIFNHSRFSSSIHERVTDVVMPCTVNGLVHTFTWCAQTRIIQGWAKLNWHRRSTVTLQEIAVQVNPQMKGIIGYYGKFKF